MPIRTNIGIYFVVAETNTKLRPYKELGRAPDRGDDEDQDQGAWTGSPEICPGT